MKEQWITSVGIDLGTSTTKWIVSRLKLIQTSGDYSLPRYEITERRLAYVSPIFTTPLASEKEIDVVALSQLLEKEYDRAGVSSDIIQSGAIIITGETATKHNAEQIVHALARTAGQFVVAAAGADLESLLAGKGSGAEAYSRTQRGIITNVDIGGGTANAAYFRDGDMIATVTMHVGGRLVRLDETGRIEYIAGQLKQWDENHPDKSLLVEGEVTSFSVLQAFCRRLVKVLINCMLGKEELDNGSYIESLLISRPVRALPFPDEIWISGGVGGLMAAPAPTTLQEVAQYGDIGPLLAATLCEEATNSTVRLRQAEESERATVIGVGTQTMEISGATLYYDEEALPLLNIPVAVCCLPDDEEDDLNKLEEAILIALDKASSLYSASQTNPPFALAFRGGGYYSYRRLQKIADTIIWRYAAAEAPLDTTLLIICENDMAKALGHALVKRLAVGMKLICVDQIKASEGDYIDVGKPLKEDIIPVVIKTLMFQRKEYGGGRP
ncbi:ethanolamine ammonia-lyase reactivating factor EutA [Paenibacillus sp. GP183]|uniref:ethanolamine ammonia-lyase reactivating factor EutA n=1 Tax=Paenibacillus sp. GP183 TaxID=1882751 RepID=UPI00089AC2F7|nr:ethanolamine ammonia-lyase reactivating factor EutA [Paenibacillus sp. GP183]SEC80140.1 ethanolamine utilization protein EutA [Paenibacillus sp. GP183]